MEVDSSSESTNHDRIVQVRLSDFSNLIIGIFISLPAVHQLNYRAQEFWFSLNFVECVFAI